MYSIKQSKKHTKNPFKKEWLCSLAIAHALAAVSASSFAMSKVEPPTVEIGQSEILKEAHQTAVMHPDSYSASQQSYEETGQYLSIWQGMNHEWRRFIIDKVNGRIPHRISTYENYLVPGLDSYQLTSRMGQNTGVDGNYMYPTSRAIAINSNDLDVAQGSISLKWEDEVSAGDVPSAQNRIEYALEIPDQPWREGHSSVFLQGFSLKTACDRSVESNGCNSDGMWPYLYHISVEDCQASQASGTRCTLAVNISRAWTPNYGGFQLIGEVKPLNKRLQYDLTVYYAGLSGENQHIAAQVKSIAKYENALQEPNTTPQNVLLSASHDQRYDEGLAAITGFGFMLTPAADINAGWKMLGSDVRQRGRYIARQQFEILNTHYNADSGLLDVSVDLSLWAPNTVVNSDFTAEMDLQLIELSNANRVVDRKHLEGRICINSKAEAPGFSKWKACDKQTAAAIKKFGGVEKENTEVNTMIGVSE